MSTKKLKPIPFSELQVPKDIVILILSFLDPEDLASACLACREWQELSLHPIVKSSVEERNFRFQEGSTLAYTGPSMYTTGVSHCTQFRLC
jgi:hypothetical protein